MADAISDEVITDVSSLSWIHWLGVLLSLGIATINIFIGYTEGQLPFFVIGSSFLLGVVLFVSRFWRPIQYLLGVLHVGILAVLWILDGMQFFEFGVITGGLSVGLAAIALHLFFEEEGSSNR